MSYRIFTRTWWKNNACTIPGAGRKTTIATVATEQEAREVCASKGLMRFGSTRRGPRGLAYEYEER